MNPVASVTVVESFLKGCVEVLDALFSLSLGSPADMFDEADIAEATAADLAEALQGCPAVLRARLKRGGAVALLLSNEDASRFSALAQGQDPAPKEALDEGDLSTLTEVAGSCLGGGVSSLMEVCGLDAEQVDDVSATVASPEDSDLGDFVGQGAVMAPFRFSAPPALDGQGVFVFSSDIEGMVSEEETDAAPEEPDVDNLAANAHLTEAEMSDILSGFSPEAEEELPVPEEPSAPPATSTFDGSNLDMVLDIKLVAVARLGRVEMPIGEILGLGPGSIIEVGHLVDEPVELLVNEKLIARGDVVVVDEKFGLRITEIISPQERIESLR